MEKWRNRIEGNELKLFSIFSAILLAAAAFACAAPAELAEGMKRIVLSRDALITDYFELADYGAAFLNASLVMGISIFLLISQRAAFTGITMAAVFINAGFGLFGKNPVNILPILAGTALYAAFHKAEFRRYLYTALFGTCLSPLVTELVFLLPFPKGISLLAAVLTGVFVGFVLPPLTMHTASMHMGYNLFNVGFSAGILAFAIVCVLQSAGLSSSPVLLWRQGRPPAVAAALYAYFLLTVGFGILLNKGRVKGFFRIFRHPGRAVADFVLTDGAGVTLMNMGTVGIAGTTYVLFIRGDFAGPVVGVILTAFGFAAFGAHLKNFLPVLAGVFGSTFFSRFSPTTPGIQMAAVSAVALAPVAGQFGPAAGVLAGMLHAAVVMNTSQLYGGLNLYNNGFSAGWVAVVMVPVLESFMKRFKKKRRGVK